MTAQNGRTYFLAARLLPAPRRRAVHALYAFARIVDDIVDEPGDDAGAAILAAVEATTFAALDGRRDSADPALPAELIRVLPAFVDSVTSFDIPHPYFRAFFASMRMDAPDSPDYRPVYSTMSELSEYTYGSAVVIGLQLLPVLGVSGTVEEAVPAASDLGDAFQLTNFIRDVGEDLDRGRLYLPSREFSAFGVDVPLLEHGRRTETVDIRVQRALAHFIALTRARYRAAEPGIALLDARVQPSIRTAFVLYGAILEQVEDAGYRILHRRVTVPSPTRLRVAIPGLVKSTTYGRILTGRTDSRVRRP
ncbi:phytoene/squalene synthase family protein [Rhodococcus sp. 27YEA15]|uniref:phytoene/squalene synthase family protein n=1 Tax=Rhodococcus sp. 27YEA15 TaxID=3156259 RepID=UPI003C7E101C